MPHRVDFIRYLYLSGLNFINFRITDSAVKISPLTLRDLRCILELMYTYIYHRPVLKCGRVVLFVASDWAWQCLVRG